MRAYSRTHIALPGPFLKNVSHLWPLFFLKVAEHAKSSSNPACQRLILWNGSHVLRLLSSKSRNCEPVVEHSLSKANFVECFALFGHCWPQHDQKCEIVAEHGALRASWGGGGGTPPPHRRLVDGHVGRPQTKKACRGLCSTTVSQLRPC